MATDTAESIDPWYEFSSTPISLKGVTTSKAKVLKVPLRDDDSVLADVHRYPSGRDYVERFLLCFFFCNTKLDIY